MIHAMSLSLSLAAALLVGTDGIVTSNGDLSLPIITTVAGSLDQNWGYDDGVGTSATFATPSWVATDSSGTFALVVSCVEARPSPPRASVVSPRFPAIPD